MIFNITSGGIAYISVTAPTGASITATCSGVTVTGTGTCTLEVPVIGTWSITCVYDSTTKTSSVNVQTLGSTYSVTFTYTATISVTTHPSASVSATKSGQTTLSGTANSSGVCTLTVPAGGRGSWNVTANNGAVSASASVNVAAYDNTYSTSLLRNIPIINFTAGGSNFTYKGAEINNSYVKVTPSGSSWKAWIKDSCYFTFALMPTNIDICLVGKGGNGSNYSSYNGQHGGNGGGGGGIASYYGQGLWGANVTYTAYVNSTGTSIYQGSTLLFSVANGADGANGGASGGNSGAGGDGSDIIYQQGGDYYTAGSDGGNGGYAFASSGFDGIRYAPGGGGGGIDWDGGTPWSDGATNGAAGSGGTGGSSSSHSGVAGKNGIILMRNAA